MKNFEGIKKGDYIMNIEKRKVIKVIEVSDITGRKELAINMKAFKVMSGDDTISLSQLNPERFLKCDKLGNEV